MRHRVFYSLYLIRKSMSLALKLFFYSPPSLDVLSFSRSPFSLPRYSIFPSFQDPSVKMFNSILEKMKSKGAYKERVKETSKLIVIEFHKSSPQSGSHFISLSRCGNFSDSDSFDLYLSLWRIGLEGHIMMSEKRSREREVNKIRSDRIEGEKIF